MKKCPSFKNSTVSTTKWKLLVRTSKGNFFTDFLKPEVFWLYAMMCCPLGAIFHETLQCMEQHLSWQLLWIMFSDCPKIANRQNNWKMMIFVYPGKFEISPVAINSPEIFLSQKKKCNLCELLGILIYIYIYIYIYQLILMCSQTTKLDIN